MINLDNKSKKIIYLELDGTVADYLDEIKSKRGMNNANALRYCIFETWKQDNALPMNKLKTVKEMSNK